jgi:hypothetical protein
MQSGMSPGSSGLHTAGPPHGDAAATELGCGEWTGTILSE